MSHWAPPAERHACPLKRGRTHSRPDGGENLMPTSTELRKASQLYREAMSKETSLHLKKFLASHAHALTQLAEKMERAEPVQEERVA
jgi:hypothetical protein